MSIKSNFKDLIKHFIGLIMIAFDDGWKSAFEVAIPKCLIKASGENKDKLTKIINKSFNDTPMDGDRAYFNI